MDIEILQKYRADGGGDYSLVYKSEGKDDPYGDMPISNSEELSGEIGISLSGEVTMATTSEDGLEKLFESYGGSGAEPSSMSAYSSSTSHGYEPETIEAPAKEEKKEEEDE